MIKIVKDGNSLAVHTPYNRGFVTALKSQVPAGERRWDADRKAWIIAPQHGVLIAEIIRTHYKVWVQPPKFDVNREPETKLLKIEYIGMAKSRGGDERTAYGYHDGEWSVVFPEKVLKHWFWELDTPGSKETLYGVLGIKRNVDQSKVRSAFRRLARQWHPDVCSEPGAAEQFLAIKDAYELLSDSNKRARYDAGLALETTLEQTELAGMSRITTGYRTPLRCGWLLVSGVESVGRFVVSEILQWEDIKNERGEVMVSSWPAGSKKFEVNWA